MDILFLNQPGPEYGQSILYDGLRELGHRVIDYPFNHTFHFQNLNDCDLKCQNGPCQNSYAIEGCLNHSAHMMWAPQFQDIDDGWKPDVIVANKGFGNEKIFQKFNNCKIIALDLGDSTTSFYSAWCQCIGRKPDAFFRREYIKGQEGYPLSYAFPESKSCILPQEKKKYLISCIMRPTNSIRKVIAEIIKKEFGDMAYVGEAKYQEYLDITSKSWFSIAMPGAGEDTVRYWEIVGRGSILVAPLERNIVINNDFINGINCIKVMTTQKLIECIDEYSKDINSLIELQHSSFEHYKQYHTTKARAAEMLEKIL